MSAAVAHGSQRFEWMSVHRLPRWPYWIFLQNIWMVKSNSLGAFGLGVTWSLTVEEQFYLTLPLVVRILERQRLKVFAICGVVLAPLLRISLHFVWPTNIHTFFVRLP